MVSSTGRARASIAVVAVCVAVAVYVLVTSLQGADGKKSAPARGAAGQYAYFTLETPHVLSTYSTYSTQGLGAELQPSWPTRQSVLSATALDGPIARYKRYAIANLAQMEARIGDLERSLAAGDAASSKAAWGACYASYLRLGGVYLTGKVAALNDAIDGTSGGLPGGVSNPHFEGLHRIEYGLWTGRRPQTLLPWARRLGASVRKLRALLPGVSLNTLEYGTRAHEILEDAQRDLLSGADVPWSEEGVLATESGLAATEEIVSTLHPLLADEDNPSAAIAPAVDGELATLAGVFQQLASEHGGRLPRNGQLTGRQAELLDGALGGALEALSRIPVELEAEAPLGSIKIPASDARTVP